MSRRQIHLWICLWCWAARLDRHLIFGDRFRQNSPLRSRHRLSRSRSSWWTSLAPKTRSVYQIIPAEYSKWQELWRQHILLSVSHRDQISSLKCWLDCSCCHWKLSRVLLPIFSSKLQFVYYKHYWAPNKCLLCPAGVVYLVSRSSVFYNPLKIIAWL